ncbi:MAG: hypothetical protein ACXVA9_03895 [Bdellovibrionales bacterium]
MRFLTALAVMVCSVTVFANEPQVKPMTRTEQAKLIRLGQTPRLAECLTDFKFDFFAEQLGLSIDGSATTPMDALNQLRTYLNTGKLLPQNTGLRVSKEVTKHCETVAQTAVELLAIRLIAKPTETSETTDPEELKP